MRKLTARLHTFCLREKGHLVVAAGYILSTFWHSSALMSGAYGVAALMTTHVIHRTGQPTDLKHKPKHLAAS